MQAGCHVVGVANPQKKKGRAFALPFWSPLKDARALESAGHVPTSPFLSLHPDTSGRVWIAATIMRTRACQHDCQINNNSGELRIAALAIAASPARALLRPASAARNAEPLSRKGTVPPHACRKGERSRMKHATTREVFAYWDNCRGDRLAPERSDIEPGAIRASCATHSCSTFDHEAGHPFRLAGTRLCALMGCELKGETFRWLCGTRRRSRTMRDLSLDDRATKRRARRQRARA